MMRRGSRWITRIRRGSGWIRRMKRGQVGLEE